MSDAAEWNPPATVTLAGEDLLMLLAASGAAMKWVLSADERPPADDSRAMFELAERSGMLDEVPPDEAGDDPDYVLTTRFGEAYRAARLALGLEDIAQPSAGSQAVANA